MLVSRPLGAAHFALLFSLIPAVAHSAEAGRTPVERDIVLILDASRSTMDPWPPSRRPPNSPSLLIQELRAARAFLEALHSEGTAVGLIVFSLAGATPDSTWRNQPGAAPPAWTEAPLTNDFGHLDRVLRDLEDRVPDGGNHLAAAVDQGTIELRRLSGAKSAPRPGSHAAMVILTGSVPTLPYGASYQNDNLAAVRRALGRAARADIDCYMVALGPNAGVLASLGDAVSENRGWFVHVENPPQLVPEIIRLAERLSPRRPLSPGWQRAPSARLGQIAEPQR